MSLARFFSRHKYGPRTVFIWASDDPEWVRAFFGHKADIYLLDDFTAGQLRQSVAAMLEEQ